MELFVREIAKTALGLLCAGGVTVIALGVVLFFWPELVRLVAVCSLVLAGAYLCGGAAYAVIKANLTRN